MNRFTFSLRSTGLWFGLAILLFSCDKTIQESQVTGYAPAQLDERAGSWKTYVLTSPTSVSITEPVSVNSAAYRAELTALKQQTTGLTPDQQDAVAYWGAGAVYRWNEIARELCARYNVPPASTADGKYPVPDPANPLADPRFPFANPPYTSRALAYLSVGQYDALVSAWQYKYMYNRPAPSKTDASLTTLLPATNLPGYPSEDAVVASVSAALLKVLFPGEVAFLDAKLAEHRASRQWAGMNVESDLIAGEQLGQAVAARVLAVAKTDGMSAANDQSVTGTLSQAAKDRGLTTVWASQEIPARPAMLPNYGKVRTWNFTPAQLVAIRPDVPPALNSVDFSTAMDELQHLNTSQTREQARIANYWNDGVGSYTPPGHWHRLAANTAHDARYSEVRMARTMALVGTALMDAGISCWEAKYYYYYPRPQQFGMKTSIGLPNFPSYPSGHGMFSAAGATVLGYIFPNKADEFAGEALEASSSRLYGGIHFRFDATNAIKTGNNVGAFAVMRGKADGSGL